MFHLQIEFQNNLKISDQLLKKSEFQLHSSLGKESIYSSIPGNGKLKNVKTNNNKIVNDSIIVLPILKNVEDTIVGTIKRIAKGLNMPQSKIKEDLIELCHTLKKN